MSALVLIGPPGAGKTTIGRSLAELLAIDFVDTDESVEAETGQTVSEIFVSQGEPAFRALERQAVIAALNRASAAPLVVALGGGAPLNPATAAELSRQTVVFLDVSAALAARRVGLNTARPLLTASPRRLWRELMARRRPLYETLADVTIRVDGLDAVAAARRIAAVWAARQLEEGEQ
jgi:shikimate kinase